MSPQVRALVQRVYDEAPGNNIAFVAGWRVHTSTEKAAFKRGLIRDAGPDLWEITAAGLEVIAR